MLGVVEFGGLGFGDGLGFGLVVVWRALVWLGFGGGVVWGLAVVRGLVVVGVWRGLGFGGGLAVVWGLAWFGVWRGSLTVCWELAVGAGGLWWGLGGWCCVWGGWTGLLRFIGGLRFAEGLGGGLRWFGLGVHGVWQFRWWCDGGSSWLWLGFGCFSSVSADAC